MLVKEKTTGLYRKGLTVKNDDVHWIREGLKLEIGESENYQCRIRYRQALTEAKLIQNNNELLISFNNFNVASHLDSLLLGIKMMN